MGARAAVSVDPAAVVAARCSSRNPHGGLVLDPAAAGFPCPPLSICGQGKGRERTCGEVAGGERGGRRR